MTARDPWGDVSSQTALISKLNNKARPKCPDIIDASLQEIFYGALAHNPKMRITAAEAEKKIWRYILSLKR